jgi:hypothetical protein
MRTDDRGREIVEKQLRPKGWARRHYAAGLAVGLGLSIGLGAPAPVFDPGVRHEPVRAASLAQAFAGDIASENTANNRDVRSAESLQHR